MTMLKRTILACLITAALAIPGLSEATESRTFKVGEGAPTLTVTLGEGVIRIQKGTETIQDIPCDEETLREAENFSMDFVSLIDMNFDGFLDLQIPESLGSINVYYACYLWNPATESFERNDYLEEITSPRFDPARKEISSFCHGSATDNVEALYAWRNGRLTMLWRKTQSYDEDLGRFVLTEENLREDGTLGTDFERSFSEEEMDRYMQGDSGVDGGTRKLMERASEQILGFKIVGEPTFHGEALTEGKGVTAWLVDLENGDLACFEVSYDGSKLYMNKGGDNGTFRIEFGEKVTLGKRVD